MTTGNPPPRAEGSGALTRPVYVVLVSVVSETGRRDETDESSNRPPVDGTPVP